MIQQQREGELQFQERQAYNRESSIYGDNMDDGDDGNDDDADDGLLWAFTPYNS